MKNKMRIKILLLLAIAILTKNVYSQNIELGGWLGTSHYFGELNTEFSVVEPGFAGGVGIRFLFNDRVSLQSMLGYAWIYGSDKNSNNTFEKKRNLSFTSPIIDFTNQIEFNFLPYVHGSSDFFTPYLSAGLSVFYYDPRAEIDGKKYSLRDLGTEGQAIGEEYFEYTGALVTGIGMKWDITHVWSMNFEVSYRFTFTDYVDDVSTVYPNPGELESLRGEIAAKLSDRSGIPGFAIQGQQRGNSRDTDNLMFLRLSMMYYFGTIDCPKINKYQR